MRSRTYVAASLLTLACAGHAVAAAEVRPSGSVAARAAASSRSTQQLELEALLARHPSDAWAQRELAVRRADQGRLEEALSACDQACAIAPQSPTGHLIRAYCLDRLNRRDEALEATRKAVTLDVDDEAAVDAFFDHARAGAGTAASTQRTPRSPRHHSSPAAERARATRPPPWP